MREVMNDSDMATFREEQDRELATMNVLNGNAMNPMRGPSICPGCEGRNDRAHEGYKLCSYCAESHGWWK